MPNDTENLSTEDTQTSENNVQEQVTDSAQPTDAESATDSQEKSGSSEEKQDSSENAQSNEEKRIAELEIALEEAKKAEAAAKDSELRNRAEMENFKRRKEQEALTFKKYAAEKFIQNIIPILDSLDQASKQEVEGAEGQVVEGIRLIHKQLLDSLSKEGVTEIEALDQPFNPDLHQAISQQKVDGKESNIVVEEMQKGYKLHDRVVRPSMVVVSE